MSHIPKFGDARKSPARDAHLPALTSAAGDVVASGTGMLRTGMLSTEC
jgi:hypothetical protein